MAMVNPNMGYSVDQAFLEREFMKAELAGGDSFRGFMAKHANVEIGLNLRSDRWAGADFWQAQAKVQACLDAIPSTTPIPGGVIRLQVKSEVQPNGSIKDPTVDGPAPADALACAKGAINASTFPKFGGPPVPSSFSLTYTRAQAPPPAAK